MTEKEFNLSEKIEDDCDLGFPVLDVDDVKEFIRRLKEEFCEEKRTDIHILCEKCEIIDKLAGEELK